MGWAAIGEGYAHAFIPVFYGEQTGFLGGGQRLQKSCSINGSQTADHGITNGFQIHRLSILRVRITGHAVISAIQILIIEQDLELSGVEIAFANSYQSQERALISSPTFFLLNFKQLFKLS